MQISQIGHVHFFFLCVDFIRVGSRFSVKYGLKVNTAWAIRSTDKT